MDYIQSIGGQTVLFLRSVGFGFFLGVLYDALRFFRMALGKKGARFFWDVLFGVAAAIGTFFYALVFCDGQIRFFMLTALCAGSAVWFVFVSPAARRKSDRVLLVLQRLFANVCSVTAKTERAWTHFNQKRLLSVKKILKKLQKNKKTT